VSIRCPCCRQAVRGDVWYDCRCFRGGNKRGCENCKRAKPEQDAHIVATMREWGWDKDPSPGMLDYLTPGWRDSPTEQNPKGNGGGSGGSASDGDPF